MAVAEVLGGFRAFALLLELLQAVAQIAQRSGEEAGHGAERRRHATGQLSQQLLAPGKRSKPTLG